jgi:DNA-binding NtrC family response regulator
MHHILIVDEDQSLRAALRRLLERHGYNIDEACSAEEAISQADLDSKDVIITNLRLPGRPGTDLISQTPTPVLVLTSYASLRNSIDSLKIGAVDYLSIPLDHEQILGALERLQNDYVKETNVSRSNPRPSEQPVAGMRGSCPAMIELFRRIRKVAMTNSPVLIQGESGTGKELVARALHEGSSRKDASLVSVNCAAIPANLIESELFGHDKGAFPGATTTRTGLLEAANNGTLFLDEISELPLDAQARLLRVLQEHEIRRVGSVDSHKVDIRLVAATSRDLSQVVADGNFRDDLFYRINVMPLQIPPLRDRGSDILGLAEIKLEQCCNRLDVASKKFSADAIQVITTYPWPGNVRELENAIERAVILTEGTDIPMDLLGLDVELVKIDSLEAQAKSSTESGQDPSPGTGSEPENLSLQDYFQRFVLENQDQLNETQLAQKLGISRKCLWERRQRFNIPRKKKNA